MFSIQNNRDLNTSIGEFWNSFYAMPHSGLIASKSALRAIYCQAIVLPPRSILEFGTGIGTISTFLLQITTAKIVTIEKEPQFLALGQNNVEKYLLTNPSKKNSVVFQGELLPNVNNIFDWVIIDASVNKSEWQLISKMKGIDLFIIENQRFISRIKVLNILLKNRLRFQYSEVDTTDETGIAVFKINSRGSRKFLLYFLDYFSTFILLLPRFLRGTYIDRGKNLFINKP